MKNLFIAVTLMLLTACAGMGTGKSKIQYVDEKGNPVIIEHEVDGPSDKKVVAE